MSRQFLLPCDTQNLIGFQFKGKKSFFLLLCIFLQQVYTIQCMVNSNNFFYTKDYFYRSQRKPMLPTTKAPTEEVAYLFNKYYIIKCNVRVLCLFRSLFAQLTIFQIEGREMFCNCFYTLSLCYIFYKVDARY